MKRSATAAGTTVDVFALAEASGRASGALALDACERLAPLLASTAGQAGWVLAGGTDALGRPAATLALRAELTIRCDKCELDLAWPVERSTAFWFVRSEDDLQQVPIDDADAEALVGSARFDVAQLVEDELILAIPISPRHPHCEPQPEGAATGSHRPLAALGALKRG